MSPSRIPFAAALAVRMRLEDLALDDMRTPGYPNRRETRVLASRTARICRWMGAKLWEQASEQSRKERKRRY